MATGSERPLLYKNVSIVAYSFQPLVLEFGIIHLLFDFVFDDFHRLLYHAGYSEARNGAQYKERH